MDIILNECYIPLITTEKRYVEIFGGRRSGKSYAIRQIQKIRALSNSYRHIFALRKVGKTTRLSVWAGFKSLLSELGLTDRCELNSTNQEIKLPNGAIITCMGVDDPEKLKSLEGATDIWLEEATEFTEEDFDIIDAGLSPTTCNGTIWLSHNPIPRVAQNLTWIEKRFHRGRTFEPGKIYETDREIILKTTYKQNLFCSQAVIDTIESYKVTNPDLYKMWALGDYVEMRGVILSDWDIVDSVPDHAEFVGYGLDFGFSIDPAACVKVWKNNLDIWVQGILYNTGLTSEMLYNELVNAGVDIYDSIKADKASPQQIEELYLLGFKGIKPCDKHANYKFDASQMLKGYHIHIVGENSDMVSEFSTWAYQKDKNNKEIPKVTDGNDHYIDALIYVLYNKKDNYIRFLDAQALGL